MSSELEKQLPELKNHAASFQTTHMRDLLNDAARSDELYASFDGIHLDYSRQRMTAETKKKLLALADAAGLKQKIDDQLSGKIVNPTEGRAVLHTALRADKNEKIEVGGDDVVFGVHSVLDKIAGFASQVRSGSFTGVTGKKLTNVVSIGIGGSYLGPEFVFEALKFDATASKAAEGRTLRFLANVDPVDVARATEGLDAETTLVIVVSKTFTTAETMLNARTMRNWLISKLGEGATAKHMIAVSSNLKAVEEFGINPDNTFGFWDWVGGRYSVCCAVGMMPLSLHYGFDVMNEFLAGARSVDQHFRTAPFEKNLPVLLGLLGVWNSTVLGHPTRAVLPYSQALLRFAAHIQQLEMESNGKRVRTSDGAPLSHTSGEIIFGEPGTNGQHSFYQLIHQGHTIPAEFIGYVKSQNPIELKGEVVSNHDELMSNFFAQPDALACGKTESDLVAEGVPAELVPHKVFTGDRPSVSILLPELTAKTAGQLLAIYEHRTAVQGYLWGINSFDQWGVELGKVLAKNVRNQLNKSRTGAGGVQGFNPSTTRLLNLYLQK